MELGPKFLSSGYHLADDHTPETQKRALTKLISDSGECVLLIALLLHRGPLPGTETGSFCLWAGLLLRQQLTKSASKQEMRRNMSVSFLWLSGFILLPPIGRT